jgi:hypothetical protein
MRRYHLVLAISLPLAGLWLASCKSGTTSPEQPGQLMPLAEGNYWVYDSYELDSNYQRTGTKSYDSLYVGASMALAGRTAYPVFHYDRDDTGSESFDTLYYSVDADGSLWQYMSLSGEFQGVEVPTIPARWVKVTTSGSESTWNVLTDSATITYSGIPLKINLKVIGSKAGTEEITLQGKAYTAQRFSQTFTAEAAGGFAKFTGTVTESYIPGIGRAKSYATTVMDIPLAGMKTKSGTESVLVRYRVAAK